MKISVIIPTRNRPVEVVNVLQAMARQSRPPDEVILIDSSDDHSYTSTLQLSRHTFLLRIILSEPSVCIQRNLGIRAAGGDWIFLCDDDIIPEPDYLLKLEGHAMAVDCSAVSGLVLQMESGEWVHHYPVKTLWELTFRFVFQLSLWGDVDNGETTGFLRPLRRWLSNYYSGRGNTISHAGWPIITNWSGRFTTARVFSLGAALIKKEYLLRSPYDETLDPSGIGDNYGVAIGFPIDKPIHILLDASVKHVRAEANRVDQSLAYFRRVLALHYFIRKNKGIASVPWLVWSLTGSLFLYVASRKPSMVRATVKAISLIVSNQNPYWIGFLQGKKKVSPEL